MTSMRQKKHDMLKIVVPNEPVKPRIGVLYTKYQPNKKKKNKNRVKHKNRLFE